VYFRRDIEPVPNGTLNTHCLPSPRFCDVMPL